MSRKRKEDIAVIRKGSELRVKFMQKIWKELREGWSAEREESGTKIKHRNTNKRITRKVERNGRRGKEKWQRKRLQEGEEKEKQNERGNGEKGRAERKKEIERRKARKERMKNKIKTKQDQHECTNKSIKIKETK